MTSRARAVETTPATPTTESRRRADRARWASHAREHPSESESTAAPRLDYSATTIPATPSATSNGAAAPPDAALPGLAPAPAPGITAEQVAAREAQTAAAVASLENSQDSPGLMQAFAAAPPTIKAQVSGELGTRLSTTLEQETTAISQHTPEIAANLNGNTPAPAGTIALPVASEVSLEPTAPLAAPAPESLVGDPVRTEGEYASNASVVNQLRNNFNSESGARDVDRALDSVQTSDPSITASPGSAPSVPHEGETDPQRFQNQANEGGRQANETLAQQQAQAQALPGAERVQLADVQIAQTVGELTVPTAQEAAAPEGAQQYLALNEPPEVQTAFDQVAAAPMQQSMAEAQAQIDQAASERDAQHQHEVQTAQEQTADAQRQAEVAQRNQVAEAQQTISTERASTLEQQQAAVADLQQQADTRREADRNQFDERTRSDQEQIDNRYTQAETDAGNEIARGEREARAERDRAERESSDRSWWEAAIDFITSVFDALVAAINTIFDAVRSAVNAILTAVRDFAVGLIRLAAEALRGLIEAFGTFLRGLVEGLLGNIFPGLARALVAAIDAAVDLANRAIDRVANALVAAVNSIVEALRAGIAALIDVFQAGVNAALALARAALTGDWSGFLLQLLEAACRVVGIDPQQIYQLIGRARETIQLIVDNPGQFFANLLESLLGGFRRFADNFLTHLQAGVIGWLTGALGGAGITIPERFDLMGVISLVGQVLGLTWQNVRQRIVRFVGERGAQVIEFVAGYVETLIQGGWSALWERIQQDLASLRDMVFDQLRTFLVERVIMGAVTRLATMFNPVGALVNIVMAAYQFYTFIRDQLQRIMQVVTTIVDAISNIARSVLAPAQERIESFLAGLLPLAIDLLARLIGLGNVGERVRQILQRVQDSIWRAIDRLIERVVGMFRGGSATTGPTGTPAAVGAATGGEDQQIGEDLTISPPQGGPHHLFLVANGQNAVLTIRSEPQPLSDLLSNWERSLNSLETHRQPVALDLITRARGLMQNVDQEADVIAVARYQALQRSERNVARDDPSMRQRETNIAAQERQIVPLLVQLFPMFVDDTRDVAGRFELALSKPELNDVERDQKFMRRDWETAFGLAERSANYDMTWGTQSNRLEQLPRNNYRLKLSDDELVSLAARVISAGGRMSTLLGHGRPYFMTNDLVDYCVATERLPNDRAVYIPEIVTRIIRLLGQRAEIREDQQTPGQYIFAEVPTQRGIPATFDSDRYRRHFYINGSNFLSAKTAIINREFPIIDAAVDDLLSTDQQRVVRGQRVWNQLRQREAVYRDRDFSTYDPAALKVRSNWDADHIVPLALHWGQGNPAGNNTTEAVRHEIAHGTSNLRIMWGPKNSEEQARGGSYARYRFVLRGFGSLVTSSAGPAYVDHNEKFIEYVP